MEVRTVERQIAPNRFGLGARSGDQAPPADARGWLNEQIARYKPAAAAAPLTGLIRSTA